MRCLLAAMLLCTSSVYAQGVYVFGAGSVGCGEYLEDRRQNQHSDYYTSYVYGLMSGYNLFGKHQKIGGPAPKVATVHAYLEKHCRDNPLDNMTRASMFLIGDLGGWKPPK